MLMIPVGIRKSRSSMTGQRVSVTRIREGKQGIALFLEFLLVDSRRSYGSYAERDASGKEA
ncbi:hypothetical protein [Streptomyces cuspidosporus]|uniref:Transposase n=1 Tax=Streptomyces cuspidosporus TaxID=66882 RepID=A0ABN3GNA3_9ACTN